MRSPTSMPRTSSSLLVTDDPRARDVAFTAADLVVKLVDGRSISIPLDWLPRLKNVSSQERGGWKIHAEDGEIRWEDLDEDLSVPVLFGLPH